MKARRRIVTALAMAGVLVSTAGEKPVHGQAAPPAHSNTRGVYLSGTRLGVVAEVEIERGTQHGMVPTTFEFQSGDRFWIHLTVNQDAYIYVINRTLIGTPQQVTRGVKLMADSDRAGGASADTYKLVFPAPNTRNLLVRANKPTKIPGAGQFFAMDQVAGAEKVLVVASRTPLPLTSQYFNKQSGALLASAKTVDSAGSVLGRLNDDLVRMAGNTETDEAPNTRSIKILPNPFPADTPPKVGSAPPPPQPPVPGKPSAPPPNGTIAVVKNQGQPLVLDLTLLHLPK